MLEFEYFEKFKTLGKHLAYGEIVDTISELKTKYIEEAGSLRSYKETEKIIETLDMVSNIAIIKRGEYLKQC